MSSNIRAQNLDTDIVALGAGFLQDDEAECVYPLLPRALVNSIIDNYGKTTYRIPDLGFGQNQGGGNALWVPGQSIGDGVAPGEVEVICAPKNKKSDVISQIRGSQSRVEYFRNALPTLTSQIVTGVEFDLMSFLINTTVFGSAKAFSGAALDTLDLGNQRPVQDIQGSLKALRPYQKRKTPLVCIMDSATADVMATRPEYAQNANVQTTAAGGNVIGGQDRDSFLASFKRVHRLDYVWVSNCAPNYAVDGASKTITYGAAVLWFGIIDMRNMNTDLRGGNPDPKMAPGGALLMADADPSGFRTWEDGTVNGQTPFWLSREYSFVSPYGGDMAVFYTGADIRS